MKKVVHTFFTSVSHDSGDCPEELRLWKNSEIGKFVMTHSNPQAEVIRVDDQLAWYTMCRVVANFDQETYVWYKLKFE